MDQAVVSNPVTLVYIKKNGGDGSSTSLSAGSLSTIGSDKDCDVRVQLPMVAKKQLKIEVGKNGQVYIANYQDDKNVMLNDKKVNKSKVLVPNQGIVSIGSCRFRFDYHTDILTSIEEEESGEQVHVGTELMSGADEKENSESVVLNPQAVTKVPTPIPSTRNKRRYHSSSRASFLQPIPENNESMNEEEEEREEVADLLSSVPPSQPRRSSRKSLNVSFGPILSPEYFDRTLPPNTPIRRGSIPSLQLDVLCHTPPLLKSPLVRKPISSVKRGLEGALPSTPPSTPLVSGPSPKRSRKSLPTSRAQKAKMKRLSLPAGAKIALTRGKSLPTPIKRAIASKPSLNKTKKSMATPLRKAIEGKPSLRQTKKSMATPLRKAIEGKPSLRQTKKSMATPLRKAIEGKPSLRKTKKSMATPLRKAIEAKPSLRKTKKSMATPLRKAIEAKPSLRQTKKSMATPLRKAIEGKPSLRKTKKSMATPLRKAIEGKPSLRKTKRSLPTPLKAALQAKVALRKTKKSLPTPLRDAICSSNRKLRKTKRSLPTPLRNDIRGKPSLRPVHKKIPTPLKKEIESKPSLRSTKRSLPSPLRAQIAASNLSDLRPILQRMAVNLQNEIKSTRVLRHVTPRVPPSPRNVIKLSRPVVRKRGWDNVSSTPERSAKRLREGAGEEAPPSPKQSSFVPSLNMGSFAFGQQSSSSGTSEPFVFQGAPGGATSPPIATGKRNASRKTKRMTAKETNTVPRRSARNIHNPTVSSNDQNKKPVAIEDSLTVATTTTQRSLRSKNKEEPQLKTSQRQTCSNKNSKKISEEQDETVTVPASKKKPAQNKRGKGEETPAPPQRELRNSRKNTETEEREDLAEPTPRRQLRSTRNKANTATVEEPSTGRDTKTEAQVTPKPRRQLRSRNVGSKQEEEEEKEREKENTLPPPPQSSASKKRKVAASTGENEGISNAGGPKRPRRGAAADKKVETAEPVVRRSSRLRNKN